MSSFRRASRTWSASCAAWSTCTSAARCACWCAAIPITASTPASCMCRATATTPRCASASRQIAREGFAGTAVESHAQISGSSHARVHVVVRTDPAHHQQAGLRADRAAHRRSRPHLVGPPARGADRAPAAKPRGLSARGTLPARLSARLRGGRDPGRGARGSERSRGAARAAAGAAGSTCTARAGQKLQRVHLKIVKLGDPIPISDVLPMLENFGLRVISERPYELTWPEGGAAWIQDFELEQRERLIIDIAASRSSFREAFAARLERRGGERRLQPPAARRRTRLRARSWCCAPTAATCCRPACRSARRTWSARSRRTPASPGTWCGCSRRASTRPRTSSAATIARRSASRPRSAPRSMRSRASMTTASCAPT